MQRVRKGERQIRDVTAQRQSLTGAHAELGGKKAKLVTAYRLGTSESREPSGLLSSLHPLCSQERKAKPVPLCLFSVTGEWNEALREETWMRWDACVSEKGPISGWIAPSPNRHGGSNPSPSECNLISK